MKTIWKFVLTATQKQRVFMPKGANILYAREQHETICVWAEVDDSASVEERVIEVFGTGREMASDMGTDRKYLGSAHLENGDFIFHVYERIN